MVAADPGDHLGVNCIDEGWLNTDGSVYVHTTVPATVTVYLSSNPEVIGYGYNGFPIHADSQTAASGEHIQEFTSEPFDILAAHTYFITAYAIDDDGLSWRYGTATVPHTAVVVVDKITVLNDGDEYSWNEGEISFGRRRRRRVAPLDGRRLLRRRRHVQPRRLPPGRGVTAVGRRVGDGDRGRSRASALSRRRTTSTTSRTAAGATSPRRSSGSSWLVPTPASTSSSPAPTSTCASGSRATSRSGSPERIVRSERGHQDVVSSAIWRVFRSLWKSRA